MRKIMKITSRFTVAIHTMLCINMFYKECKTTSDFIAGSVNVNPVIIRKIIGQLKSAGLIKVFAGSGGSEISKSINEITLLDIYKAVDCISGSLFNFHENPNPECPVGRNVHFVLDNYLANAEQVLESYLKEITLRDLAERLKEETDQNRSEKKQRQKRLKKQE